MSTHDDRIVTQGSQTVTRKASLADGSRRFRGLWSWTQGEGFSAGRVLVPEGRWYPVVSYGHLQLVRVQFDDLDPMGIVHHANYPRLLEHAISAYVAPLGLAFGGPKSDLYHVIREFSIRYDVPIRGYGDVGVHFWTERLGPKSADMGFRFVSVDEKVVHAEGTRKHVHIDPRSMMPAEWSDLARRVHDDVARSAGAD
ncbi:acyl-CoA thioesterase [Actinoplanes solisilvae]|uniref:acyl-CoA thioesterase n=1 Tax=Actinoplanes solisilvae TaxID=2486853 RepID=UPI000FDC1752|nr:thioesterase family protein [Actinoplanes solisilvae]